MTKICQKMPMYRSHLDSAIYLNNVGVTLMERCCYPEALETFHSALEVCRGTPSQAMVEHTVYRAFLRLSSVTDDDESEEFSTMEWASSPIIYDQFGNNITVNQSTRKDDRWSDDYPIVSPFDRFIKGGDLRRLDYCLIYFQSHNRQGPQETASLLLATILANSCQVHRVVACCLLSHGQGHQSSDDMVFSQHMEMARQLFLRVQQEVKRVSFPAKSPVHTTKEELSMPKKNGNNYMTSNNVTAVTTNTVVQRRELPPRFKSNPAA